MTKLQPISINDMFLDLILKELQVLNQTVNNLQHTVEQLTVKAPEKPMEPPEEIISTPAPKRRSGRS